VRASDEQYLEPNEGFSQAVVRTGTCKTIYISGQIGTEKT
jgi:enamine deaminase RidA (YjgF/YER057c/UK114 family)